MVLNWCIFVCIRLERLQRMAGIVWDFLSEENSFDTQTSELLYDTFTERDKENIIFLLKYYMNE